MATLSNPNPSAKKKREGRPKDLTPFYLVALILLFFSLLFVLNGVSSLVNGKVGEAVLSLVTGAIGLILSLSWIERLRKGAALRRPFALRVVSTTKCEKSGFKSVRGFRQEDYILKYADKCPKCGRPMLISSIYAETPKKVKTLTY